jgi:PAS domain S-box-containing protein
MSSLIPRTFLETLPGAMIQIDTHGCIHDFNAAADRALGRLLVNEPLAQRLDAQGAFRLAAILSGDEQPSRTFPEFEACIGDRRFRLAVGPASAVDAQRLVQLTDITKFRAMSKQLKESEQRYRSLFSEHPDAVYCLDVDGRFLEVNRRTTELTGYRYEQLIGQCWTAVVVEEDRAAVRGHFRRVLAGSPCSYRCRVIDHADSERVVQVTNVPMIVDGEVMGVFGIAQDRTEQYRLEEERWLLRVSMAQIHDTIIITDIWPLDEPGPRMVFVNEAVERMTGYRPDELLGRSPRLFQGADTDPEACRRMREALEARQPIKEVLINYRKDGTPFWNELEIVPIAATGSGEQEYFASVQRDITERKQRELELHHSRQELHRLYNAQENIREEERRRIARDLHDDLGQLLITMKLDLGRIIYELPALPEPHAERLQGMVDFIDEVIEQVREIAANLHPSILDDLGFEAAAEWFLERCAQRYDLSIGWQPGAGVSGRAVGEIATALFRMLQESLTNIHRHARASRVLVHYDEDDARAWLEVIDDGVGFAPDVVRKSGVGLAGMRERVSMFGGHLDVQSTIGKGTRVCITLPLEEVEHDSHRYRG